MGPLSANFQQKQRCPSLKIALVTTGTGKSDPQLGNFYDVSNLLSPKKIEIEKAFEFLFYIGTISKNQCLPHKVNGNYSSNWYHLCLFWKSFQNHELTLHKPTIHTSFLTTQVWFLLIFAFPTIIMIFGRHETFFVSVVQAEPFSWECQSECVSLIKAQHLHHVHYQF